MRTFLQKVTTTRIGILCGLIVFLLLPSEEALSQEALCSDGLAGNFPCSKIDLMAHRDTDWLNRGGGNGNDVWGWTDPSDQREYVLMGTAVSTVVVDITDADAPEIVFRVPAQTRSSSWRDIKVYKDHAFIVSEAAGHGMQVVDLTQVRDVNREIVPNVFPNVVYNGFGSAHNVVINQESGFAYGVGTRRTDDELCPSGLHAVDIRDPLNPLYAGCSNSAGYTHDAQCVIYRGPDGRYTNKEICFASNAETIAIIDFTDKSNPNLIAEESYVSARYVHQAWLSNDHGVLFSNDELDEVREGLPTRTIIWDLSQLDQPLARIYTHAGNASDHNMYTRGDFIFMANYQSGLRMFEIDRMASPGVDLTNQSYFDTVPESEASGTSGSWSNYPYFCSGNVAVSNIQQGLYILRPHDQRFAKENCDQAQGVEIGEFDAQISDGFIDLSWSTLQERNNLGFDILMGQNQSALAKIAFVEGQSNSSEVQNYQLRVPIPGVGDYEVQIVDSDILGNYNYWPKRILSIEIPGSRLIYESYPNPFNTSTLSRFAVKTTQRVVVELFDMLGQKLATPYDRFSEGEMTHSFEVDGSNLASGRYLLRFQGEDFMESKTLHIVR